MVQRFHVNFLRENSDLIRSPVLVVGSCEYDYDQVVLADEIRALGADEVVGIDIVEGPGVDAVVDITDPSSSFVRDHAGTFATVVCLEVLTHVVAPHRASVNVQTLAAVGGGIFLAESVVRKISRMPLDLWRFTAEGLMTLFSGVDFDEHRTRIARTRDKSGALDELPRQLPQFLHERHPHESRLGHLIRRVHRRFFASGDFTLSRSLPELTVLVAGRRSDRPDLLP